MRTNTLLCIVIALIMATVIFANENNSSSLLKSERKDTSFVNMLDSAGFAIYKTSKDSALLLAQKAYNIASKSGFYQQMANASHTLAYIYLASSDYPQALEQSNNTLAIARELNDNKLISRCLNNIGLIYRRINNFELSAKYYIECLEFREKINDNKGIINTYNGLGTLFKRMKDIDKAIYYYQKGLEMARNDSAMLMIGVFHQNLGLIYYENNQADTAWHYISTALEIFRQANNEDQMAFALNNLGLTAQKIGETEQARGFLLEALEIATRRGFKESIIDASFNLAEIEFNSGQQQTALNRFIDLERMAESQGSIYRQRDIAIKIEAIYASKMQFNKAYKYSKKIRALNDSIFNSETYSKIYDIQTRYEVDKKNYEIELLSKDYQINTARLKRAKTNLLFFILVTFIMSLFSVVVYLAFYQKKRLNQKLRQQNHEIEEQKNEIELQKEIIFGQHEAIEKELKNTLLKSEILKRENIQFQYEALKNQINPHFLFNSFSTLVNIIPDDPKTAEKYVLELSNVYRYILTSSTADLQKLSYEIEFIRSYMYLVNIRFDNNCILKINIEHAYLDGCIPLLSLQLLIENAIKHNIINTRHRLSIVVENNGNMLIVRNNLQKKTSVEFSTGIGLKNIVNRYKLVTNREVLITETHNEFIVMLPILNWL